MPLFWTSRACLATAVSIIIRAAVGAPSLAFPVNSQVPPVAYIEQPYEFTFSSNTFTTGSSEISYALAGNPTWLSIDSLSRRLSGTPTFKDAGAASFSLIASDKTGQTTSTVVLVTLQNRTISANADILTQLEQAGSVSAPATLLMHQLQHLSFSVPVSLFQGLSFNTHYYAVSADGSPLPSWLQFNPTNLHFSGTTPPLLAPTPTSQVYDFKLAASNVAGFSEVEIRFQIVVGNHLLAFTNPKLNISVTRGGRVKIPSLLEQLNLDGRKVSRSDLSSVVSNAPHWLSFDDGDLSFDGTVPKDAESSAFTISAYDNSSNTANATLLLQVAGAQVASQVDLGSYNATTGTFFSHVIQRPDSTGTASNVSADLGALSSWLRFSVQNMTVYGAVPVGIVPRTLATSITFNSTNSIVVGALTINVVTNPSGLSSSAFYTRSGTVTTSSTTAATTSTSVSDVGTSSTRRDHVLKIILCTVLPIGFLILVSALILCILGQKRKQRRSVFSTKVRVAGNTSPNSPYGATSLTQSTSILAPTSGPQSAQQRSTIRPPRIELPWAPDSIKGTRKRLSKKPRTARSSTIGPSWDDLIGLPIPTGDSLSSGALPSATIHQQSAPEIITPAPVWKMAANTDNDGVVSHPDSQQINQPRTQRASAVPSFTTAYAVGLPKRMSGAGHGSGVKGAGPMPPHRSSWQTTFGTIPLVDSRPSTVLLEPLSSSQPKTDVTGVDVHRKGQAAHIGKPTLWLVDTSSEGFDDFEAARQRFYTDRARNQLEGSSRFTSISQTPLSSRNKLEPEARQLSLHPLSENGNAVQSRYTPQSWSQWSGVGPAATSNRASIAVRPVRDYSIASSRQFDSAISSDSQWEDEDLVADENSAGERYWLTNTAAPVTRSTPRLPFEQDEQQVEDDLTTDGKTRLNLSDQRKRISVGETDLQRNQRSHKGSFRFI